MGKYYNTKESVDEYIKLALDHDGKQIIIQLKEFLPAGSGLLEIGSGPGTGWKILSEFYKVLGSDFSQEFLKHLRVSYPGGEFREMDATTLETDRTFDGIYSNKVLHHLEDEALEASIKRQSEVLNPGGIVCHTFWNGEDSEVYNDLFVNYHSDTGIRTLFEEHFDLLLIQFYKEFEKGDSILYIGKKKEQS
jgi:cyclopropane fatty-acyl-phospholipid synthase-like methyltransferase